MPTYEMQAPDGNKYRIDGPPGASDDQVREQILQQHPDAGKAGDPELAGFNLHREEGGAAGGIYKRAAQAIPGSAVKNVGELGSALWQILAHPEQTASALHEMGWEGIKKEIGEDLSKHYGSVDRAQKTFETDPVRFVGDLVTAGVGGTALLRKVATIVARAGRATIPQLAGSLMSDIYPGKRGAGLLEVAGTIGEAGGQEARRFRSAIDIGKQGTPQPAGLTTPTQEAGEALGSGGWMPRKITSPTMLGAGAELLSRGGLPPWLTSAAAAGGIVGSSPRLMGETMYGLGAMQRGAQKLPRSRTAIAAAATDLLKDRDAKKQLDNEQRKTLRKAAHGDADSSTMLRAASILQPVRSQYGGTDVGRSVASTSALAQQTPSPGQPSQPAAGPTGPGPGPAGPGGPAGPPLKKAWDKLLQQ